MDPLPGVYNPYLIYAEVDAGEYFEATSDMSDLVQDNKISLVGDLQLVADLGIFGLAITIVYWEKGDFF